LCPEGFVSLYCSWVRGASAFKGPPENVSLEARVQGPHPNIGLIIHYTL
jgi:hypothetical protein